MPIHPTAIVDPAARIDETAIVGPFCVIGAEVEIGARTELKAHVYVEGPTWIDDPALNLDLGTLGLLVEHPAAPALRSFLYDNAPALGLVCCDLTADVLHCCDGTMVERALGD